MIDKIFLGATVKEKRSGYIYQISGTTYNKLILKHLETETTILKTIKEVKKEFIYE